MAEGARDADDGAVAESETTVSMPQGEVPVVHPLALVAAGRAHTATPDPPTVTLGTAAAAMRAEEIERTRGFIRVGWVLSVAVMGTFPFVDAPLAMSLVFSAGLVFGMIVSFGLHRAFADPRRYTEGALITLAVISLVNGQLGVMYYGAFTGAPLIVMVGIHFVARTEAVRVARWILGASAIAYSVIAVTNRRNAALHGARAGPRQARRHPRRCVRARRDRVSLRDRAASVHRRLRRRAPVRRRASDAGATR